MSLVTIRTRCGPVTGLREEACVRFRAVPYAAARRFEVPVPVTAWEGTLDAAGPDTECPQYYSYFHPTEEEASFFAREFAFACPRETVESPLTLNITAPLEAQNCPVLVHIHGGGFDTGKPGDLPFGTTDEYAKRGILLVCISYRLNVFSAFRGRNLGLHDQATALEWIRDNIADFGGDPDRITVMGQSAGAMCVTDLLYSDRLEGVIRGAVLISGGGLLPAPAAPKRPGDFDAFWDGVREACGCAADEELREIGAEALWRGWYAYSRAHRNAGSLMPCVDGDLIPDAPRRLRRAGAVLDVPLLFGVTSQDFAAPFLYETALRWGIWSHRRGRSPVWAYFFDRELPGNRFRAFHSGDLWYLFGSMEHSWRPFTEEDRALSREMIDHLSAFVKNGDPGVPSLPAWEPLGKGKAFRRFDTRSSAPAFPAECRKKTWNTLLRDKGPM